MSVSKKADSLNESLDVYLRLFLKGDEVDNEINDLIETKKSLESSKPSGVKNNCQVSELIINCLGFEKYHSRRGKLITDLLDVLKSLNHFKDESRKIESAFITDDDIEFAERVDNEIKKQYSRINRLSWKQKDLTWGLFFN